jgi:hypothetical protein
VFVAAAKILAAIVGSYIYRAHLPACLVGPPDNLPYLCPATRALVLFKYIFENCYSLSNLLLLDIYDFTPFPKTSFVQLGFSQMKQLTKSPVEY